MPTYEFRCNECGHTFSVITNWSKKGEVTCPSCQAQDLKELFGNYRFCTTGGSTNGSGCTSSSGFS